MPKLRRIKSAHSALPRDLAGPRSAGTGSPASASGTSARVSRTAPVFPYRTTRDRSAARGASTPW